jgi:hypothetical protein
VGRAIGHGILALAAQYGGANAKASRRRTLSEDTESPLREVPTLLHALESVLILTLRCQKDGHAYATRGERTHGR